MISFASLPLPFSPEKQTPSSLDRGEVNITARATTAGLSDPARFRFLPLSRLARGSFYSFGFRRCHFYARIEREGGSLAIAHRPAFESPRVNIRPLKSNLLQTKRFFYLVKPSPFGIQREVRRYESGSYVTTNRFLCTWSSTSDPAHSHVHAVGPCLLL